jgi:hypothetical protein
MILGRPAAGFCGKIYEQSRALEIPATYLFLIIMLSSYAGQSWDYCQCWTYTGVLKFGGFFKAPAPKKNNKMHQ